MKKYLILGKSGAGSLIPEFLFTELKITYDIQFCKFSHDISYEISYEISCEACYEISCEIAWGDHL